MKGNEVLKELLVPLLFRSFLWMDFFNILFFFFFWCLSKIGIEWVE